jgi:hypothetical protein
MIRERRLIRSTEADTATLLRARGAPRPGEKPMRFSLSVAVTVRIDLAACLLALAAILKILT